MLVAQPTDVVCYTSAVYDMLCLLGNIALVGLIVKFITAAAQLVGSVVLKAQTAGVCRAVERTQAESVDIHLA